MEPQLNNDNPRFPSSLETVFCFGLLSSIALVLGLAWRPLLYAGQPWWLLFVFPLVVMLLPNLRRRYAFWPTGVVILVMLIATNCSPWEPAPAYRAPFPFDKAPVQVHHWRASGAPSAFSN